MSNLIMHTKSTIMKITVHSFFLLSLLTVPAVTAGWQDEALKYYTSAKNTATEFFTMIDGVDGAKFLRSMNKDHDFNGDLSTFIDENGVLDTPQSTQAVVQETATLAADTVPNAGILEKSTQLIANTPELALPVQDGLESFVPALRVTSPVVLLEVEKSVEPNFTQAVTNTIQPIVNAENVFVAIPVEHASENTQLSVSPSINGTFTSVPEIKVESDLSAATQSSAGGLEVQSNVGSLKRWFSNAVDAKNQALKSLTDSVGKQTQDSFTTVSNWVKENPKLAGFVGASVISAALGGAALYKYRAQIRAKYPNLFKAAGCTALATAAVVVLQNKTGMFDSVIEKMPFSSVIATATTATAAGASTALSMFAASEALSIPDHELIAECKALLEITIENSALRENKIEKLNKLVDGYNNIPITSAFNEFMDAYTALWTLVADKNVISLSSEEQLATILTTKLVALTHAVNMHI